MEKTFEMVDGCSVVVPDSLELITPYVLQEQKDWFEDEIRFVRQLLAPGQKVIDIGANYGLFTVSMARAIGPSGRVWAFEPASTTAGFLAKSLSANGFQNVVLDQRGVSSETATVQLSLNDNSELNEIVRNPLASMGAKTETIHVASLDELGNQYAWSDIDFMKIDAEGEESRIIRGGRKFFESNSPLVQYEVKAGSALHLDLIQEFSAIGYASYRLVPGLNILVPFNPSDGVDGYLLNLFCCKPDCAARLASRNLLAQVGSGATQSHDLTRIEDELLAKWNTDDRFGWTKVLARFPYAQALMPAWNQNPGSGGSDAVKRAIALHAMSRSDAIPAVDRFQALRASFERMKLLCLTEPRHLRRSTLARVACEYGARAVTVRTLEQMLDAAMQVGHFDPNEPFLTTGVRFESVPPGPVLADWLMGAALEEYEKWSHYSSFYSGQGALARLRGIKHYGFASEEMLRRLKLVEARFSLGAS